MPDLYYVPGSSPCRAVLLTAKALNLNLNLKLVDLHGGEQLKPEYLKVCLTPHKVETHGLLFYWTHWARTQDCAMDWALFHKAITDRLFPRLKIKLHDASFLTIVNLEKSWYKIMPMLRSQRSIILIRPGPLTKERQHLQNCTIFQGCAQYTVGEIHSTLKYYISNTEYKYITFILRTSQSKDTILDMTVLKMQKVQKVQFKSYLYFLEVYYNFYT